MNFLSDLIVLADSGAVQSAPTMGAIGWQIFLILLFLLLNGFFVAAEFALVKVRSSQLNEIIESNPGRRRSAQAKLAWTISSEKLNSYLSAAQLGITICSLVLGALGEPFVHKLITPWLGPAGLGWDPKIVSFMSWTIAIVSITALHVIVGEQMPKTLAIRRALGTSLWIAAPLHAFHILFQPAIWLLNLASNSLLKLLFRIEPDESHHTQHSVEELQMLVEESGKSKHVTDTERDISINALELSELKVREIMTPRTEIVFLDLEWDFKKNLALAIDSKHTRFPLRQGSLDNCPGIVHIKDLLRVVNDPKPDLLAIARDVIVAPGNQALDETLKIFLSHRVHLALAVDEFGATIGIVTLEDILEQLVGEIQDEFDNEEGPFKKISEDEFVVDGKTPLFELAEQTDLELEHPDVSTVGGYVTSLLGHLPEEGETLLIEGTGFNATVTKTDGRRVLQVHFKRATPKEKADQDRQAATA